MEELLETQERLSSRKYSAAGECVGTEEPPLKKKSALEQLSVVFTFKPSIREARDWRISEFVATLVYRSISGVATAIQRNHILENQTSKHKD